MSRPQRSSPSLPRALAAAAGVVLVVAAVWHFRLVADARDYYALANGDLHVQYFPLYQYAASQWRLGHVPLWNPFQLSGVPALATLQVAAWYPLHVVYLLLPIQAGMAVVEFVHLVMGALFFVVFARCVGLTWAGGLVVGFAFAFSGPVLNSMLWPPFFCSYAWLPLGLAAIEAMTGGRDRGWWSVALAAAVAMPILAGGYQSAAYIYYAYLGYAAIAVGRLARREKRIAPAITASLRLAAAAGVGLMIAGVQVLPTLELAEESARSSGGLRPYEMLPFGPPSAPASALLSPALVTPDGLLAFSYLGAVPVALGAGALMAGRRLWLWAFSLGCVAWGVLGMLAPTWFLTLQAALPALGRFRLPSRLWELTAVGVAILAGAGLDACSRDPTSRSGRRGVLGVVLAGVVLAAYRYPGPGWTFPLLLAPLAVVANRGSELLRSAARPAIVALVVLDLVGLASNQLAFPFTYESWRGIGRYQALFDDVARVAGLSRAVWGGDTNQDLGLDTKAATRYGIFSPFDYEPLAPRRYGDFISYASLRRTWPSEYTTSFAGVPPGRLSSEVLPLYRLLSIRYYVLPSRGGLGLAWMRRSLRRMPMPAWRIDPIKQAFALYEDPLAMPRAYAVRDAECVPELSDALARLTAPDFDPMMTVVLEAGCGAPSEAPAVPHHVVVDSYQATAVRLSVDMGTPGFVVLTDSYYPGWRALVNDKAEPILRANAVLRAVRVPAGHSVVAFDYAPRSFQLGAIVSLGGLALGLAWVWRTAASRAAASPSR